MRHCRIHILGKVQGVGFRFFTKMKADELGLLGTIENQQDGSVVVFVVGDERLIIHFISWCRYGSPASRVEDVIVKDLDVEEGAEYKDFSVLR